MDTLQKISGRCGDEIIQRIDKIKERAKKREAARTVAKLAGQTAAERTAADIVQLHRSKNQEI